MLDADYNETDQIGEDDIRQYDKWEKNCKPKGSFKFKYTYVVYCKT